MRPRTLLVTSSHSMASLVMLFLLAGCAVAQAVQSRNRDAEAMKGAEVSGGGFDRPIEYVGRIRVYASQGYRAQRAGWESRVAEMVDSAGGVLGPAFGLRLEVVETRVWDVECNPESLQECLDELAAVDPGEGVDWVIGLISAVPHFSNRFDELGMAGLPGRHFLLRDLYAAGEREAIRASFPHMVDSKRKEIFVERQKHKRLVVFLHEWAHTMGALHTRQEDAILYPADSADAAEFSEANWGLIDAALADRFPFDSTYPNLREYLAASRTDAWFSGERYPATYAIQHFGCSLAMQVGARQAAGKACRRAINLSAEQ